jgi:hypothetical protein
MLYIRQILTVHEGRVHPSQRRYGAITPRSSVSAAATGVCLDASRADSDVLPWLIGLSWATLWLGYLAHPRTLTETPLDEVAADADVPWWR